VRAITEEVYTRIGSQLGTHSLCRAVASIAAGVAAGLGVQAEVVFDQSYVERGDRSPHYWLRFSDGSRLDAWQTRTVRLRPAEP
jgi:hypothetical protein